MKILHGGSVGRSFLKKFFSFFVVILFMWYHWLRKFLIVFEPKSRITIIRTLHWCYTWTAMFSANQNWVIFSCILLVVATFLKIIGQPLGLTCLCWPLTVDLLQIMLASQKKLLQGLLQFQLMQMVNVNCF